jgi:hypothetical protein
MLQTKSIRMYRFGDCVAFNTRTEQGLQDTIYIPKALADEFGSLLIDYACDIDECKFSDSKYGTITIEDNSDINDECEINL